MEEEENTSNQQPQDKGKIWLWVCISALLALGVGVGAGVFVFAPRLVADEPAEAVEVDPAVAQANEFESSFEARLVPLEPFVVNVTGEGYPRFLKLKVELEAESPAVVEELGERLAQVRDATILLLSSKRLADVNDYEGKMLLKDDLRARINAILEKGRVAAVLFTEFVVQ